MARLYGSCPLDEAADQMRTFGPFSDFLPVLSDSNKLAQLWKDMIFKGLKRMSIPEETRLICGYSGYYLIAESRRAILS